MGIGLRDEGGVSIYYVYAVRSGDGSVREDGEGRGSRGFFLAGIVSGSALCAFFGSVFARRSQLNAYESFEESS